MAIIWHDIDPHTEMSETMPKEKHWVLGRWRSCSEDDHTVPCFVEYNQGRPSWLTVEARQMDEVFYYAEGLILQWAEVFYAEGLILQWAELPEYS